MSFKGYKETGTICGSPPTSTVPSYTSQLKPIPHEEKQNGKHINYTVISMALTGETPFDQRVPASPQSNLGVQQSDPPLPHQCLID